eukprot:scaffold14228_cov100-Skeletonema_dohrnii-CCMP3373.AAC.1
MERQLRKNESNRRHVIMTHSLLLIAARAILAQNNASLPHFPSIRITSDHPVVDEVKLKPEQIHEFGISSNSLRRHHRKGQNNTAPLPLLQT